MSTMELTNLEPSETLLDIPNTDTINTPDKRWRFAILTICYARAWIKFHLKYHAIDLDSSRHPFRIEKARLFELVRNTDMETLGNLGGVDGVASALRTDIENGILGDADDVARRQQVFGSISNTHKKPSSKVLLFCVLREYLKNQHTSLLWSFIVFCPALGIQGLKHGWYDSWPNFVCISLGWAAYHAVNLTQRIKFHKLSQNINEIHVDVVRSGRHQRRSISEIVVGDVIFLKIGDQVPVDGLFLDSHSLEVDESTVTVETGSDHVEVNSNHNPFLLSGSEVVDGYGKMLVTSVDKNNTWSHCLTSKGIKWSSNEQMQECRGKFLPFDTMSSWATTLLTGFVEEIAGYQNGSKVSKGDNETMLNKVMVLVDVVWRISWKVLIKSAAVMLPVYPVAVNLSLVYSTKKMMDCRAMVREHSAFKRMGNATTICTTKTGALTLGQMKVTMFWLCQQPMIDLASSSLATNYVLGLVREGVALNTSGSVHKSSMNSEFEYSGSPTEKALLSWAVGELETDTEELIRNCSILHLMAFDSTKKQSGVLLRRREDKSVHVHWKGAAQRILNMCSKYYDSSGILKDLNDSSKLQFEEIIQGMASSGLRCIAFAHAEVPEDDQANKQIKEDGLTLLGLVGIKDPCQPGVKDAVKECQLAGVRVKMITGDNVFTAKAVAIECGIIEPNEDGAVIEGKEFRSYKAEERMEKVNKICVMASSTPHDKVLMVQCLKKKGQKVAVTGHRENDVIALIEADIGLSIGIQAAKMAKECSDIVILDDKFETITTILRWGRYVYNNINKSTQFHLTANSVAMLVNFVARISVKRSQLTTGKLVWVNLVGETLSLLALTTEKPPVDRIEPLVTDDPWLDTFIYGFYQIEILLILLFKGESLFGVTSRANDTLIFSVFLLGQAIHRSDAVHLDWKLLKSSVKRKKFWGMTGTTVVLQLLMVELLNKISDAERLNWGQWIACIGIAIFGWPIGYVVNLLGLVFVLRSFLCIATFATKNSTVIDDKSKLHLSNLIKNKDKEALLQFEGVNGVVKYLKADETNGIDGNHQDITRRQKEFGCNRYHNLSTKRSYHFVIEAINDPVVVALTICALLSLGFNIKENGRKEGYYNGGTILIVLLVVVSFCSVSHIWPHRQINKLSEMVKEMEVEVIRNGEKQPVSISNVVVGDTVCLKEGNRVPADGLFLDGDKLKLDESSLGEDSGSVEVNRDRNPFLLYGSKVQAGFGNMLVTSVGENTKWAEITGLGNESHEWISLRRRFKQLSVVVGSVGSAITVSFSAVLLIRYFTAHPHVMSGINGHIEKVNINDKTEGGLVWLWMVVIHVLALLVGCSVLQSGFVKIGDNKKWALITSLLGIESHEWISPERNHKRLSKVMGLVGSHRAVLLSAGLLTSCFFILQPMWKWVVGIQVSAMVVASSAIPEGLPLVHALTVTNTLKKMINIGVLPRSFSACEALASATTICLCIESAEFQTDGVIKAIQDCKEAEVNMKLITGENVSTAKAAAFQFGILDPDEGLDNEQVMQAFDFRNYTEAKRKERVEKVHVLAEATSFDKLLFVKCLKDKGHVVVVTGQGEGDALAMKGADLGIHIGDQGTDIAAENSDIVVLHGGFVSAVAALHVGRGICDGINLFIQLMFTANIVSLVSDIVSIVITDHPPMIDILASVSVSEVPYAVVQMMWVKLIVGTLSALAIVGEKKGEDVLQKPPTKPGQPLINNEMCRNILVHASYEIVILLTLQFKGEAIFHLHNNVKDTLIFNLFILFRLFAVFTPWKSEGNFFSGIQWGKLYWGTVSAIVIIQVVIVETLPRVTATKTLNIWQWGACIGIAFTSWPAGYLGRKYIPVPEKSFHSYISELKLKLFALLSNNMEEGHACLIFIILSFILAEN